uniref:FHA domain-containing protein n=1 Tax=Oryza glumipatula TaxID=40148 RepID=A0A0D9ZEJ3_9ORYZ
MGALAAATSSAIWLVEDDILLKNAVETGASLEALAKGAVCFSCKFTLKEIQDRWNSLLYDPEISTQASARMVEYENDLSTSNPLKAKVINAKQKDLSFQKRKIDSVKNQYYAMRKRVRNEPCSTVDLGFLIDPCSCTMNGGQCVCGGLDKHSQGHHVVHNTEPGVSTMNCFGQQDGSYNGGQTMFVGMNGHSFPAKHAETDSMVKGGDIANSVPYGYSDVSQIYEQDAYTRKDPDTNEGNNVSLKGITDFQGSMQFQNLGSSNQCGSKVTESKTIVIADHCGVEHVHFPVNSSSRMQEPGSLQVIGQPEGSQTPVGSIWTEVDERGTFTLDDDKKIKTDNSDPLALQPNLDGGICAAGLDHAAITEGDFMDFPYFSNSEDLDLLNGENFLNIPHETNQEDLDDPDHVKNLLHPDEANICYDQTDPDHVKHNVDVSGIISVPTSLEVPYPGRFVECVLNTEDPEIPCNDDVIFPGESPLQCSATDFGQNSEHNTCLVSPATSPASNVEHSNVSDKALIKREDTTNTEPSSQPMNLSPPTSEQKEGSTAPSKGCVPLGAEPSEGPSTAGTLVHCHVDTNDANSCASNLPSISAAVFAEGSPCHLEQQNNFDDSLSFPLPNSVEVPDHMNYNSHDNQPELGDGAPLQNCIPPHELPDLGLQDPITTVPVSNQVEECSDNENDVPNYYDLEALILDQDLIPWVQDSEQHPEGVSRFQHPESRKSLIRLEQSARSYMNRAIVSKGAFAVIYGLHLRYYMKDSEVTLGRETEDIKVDVDLGKEGRANKISRRQAVIKMDEAGSFHIKNIGKCSIFVNSKEVPSCKRIILSSDSLIEIKDMRFIFHVNQDAVTQFVTRTPKPEH